MDAIYGNAVNNTKDFFQSNNYVLNFGFLILVLFVFVILLRLGIQLITYLLTPSKSPKLIQGMVDGKQMLIFEQDPNTSGAKTILRSTNENDGIEFTWSLWLFISDNDYNKDKFRHIFHKGEESIRLSENSSGMNVPNNAPGLYLTPIKNNLLVSMNTFHNVSEEVEIEDIPLNKWVNIMIRVENRTLDVYINGTVVRRHILSGIPKQNYGNVYTSMNGGFAGYISNLWYYDYGLGIREIEYINKSGADTTIASNSSLMGGDSNYLSFKWFLGNN